MKVSIHYLTYIFILISFLSGYFEYVYLLLLIIFIHECGHYFFSILIGIKNPYIIIYPFGGITVLNEDLNIPIYKEFISLIGGIVFQLLFYLLILVLYKNNLITSHVFNIIHKINYYLIIFNFLPILPLDGGRLLNIILNKIFCFNISNKISIIVSIVFILLFGLINKTLFSFILILFLIKCIYIEIMNYNTKYYKFLFERYNKKYNFKKHKNINSISKFKRDYFHIINNVDEDKILRKMFDRQGRMC